MFSLGNISVAYKRFTDIVPMTIDHELVLGIERDIGSALSKGLGINGPNTFQTACELLWEPSNICSSRGVAEEVRQTQYSSNGALTGCDLIGNRKQNCGDKPQSLDRFTCHCTGCYLPCGCAKSGHFHSCCPSPVLNILPEIL